MITIHTIALVGALLVCSTSAVAQGREPLSGAKVMTTLRTAGRTGPVGRTLRQMDGPVSRAVQDELADSLVAFVLETRANPGPIGGPLDQIVDALSWSALAFGGEDVPYAGAGERLIRIACAVDRKAAGILGIIADLPDRQEALTRLEGFAKSSRRTAYNAIPHLERMGPDGLAVLRTLWQQEAVTEPRARQSMESVARRHGWIEEPDTAVPLIATQALP